ncbi:MAG: HAMP domain-containing histidine kinase [Clostridia bacterium]|nr:HAMP domain-containing histidine kinase [Clostridia bacterium]
MIKKLRKRFILLALSVVAAVILVIVAGIDVANYVNMKDKADDEIAFVEQNTARQSSEPREGNGFPLPGILPPKDLPNETAFSARYFTVEVDEEGNVTSYNLERIAFVSASDLASYVEKATGNKGFVGNYRYRKTQTEDGSHYIFLDCQKEISSTRNFIVSSAIIASIGIAAISLLIILLSKRVLAPVEESYKKQKRFITDAGHELKTPLTVISANAELLELELGENNEWLNSIKGQVQKLGGLTKELVYLSRMDEGETVVEKAPFALDVAAEECAAGFREAALVAGKSISLELAPVTAKANEEMVRRALSLLLDNAVKYAEGAEIRLSLRKEGKWAVLEESNAASLSKGEHPELFERFYRPDASRNGATGGHGIGLSVVQSIAENNGGEVCCLSNGETVTFRLKLPLA